MTARAWRFRKTRRFTVTVPSQRATLAWLNATGGAGPLPFTPRYLRKHRRARVIASARFEWL